MDNFFAVGSIADVLSTDFVLQNCSVRLVAAFTRVMLLSPYKICLSLAIYPWIFI